MMSGKSVLLTGAAGSGKTFVHGIQDFCFGVQVWGLGIECFTDFGLVRAFQLFT